LKERQELASVEIVDKPDSGNLKYAFELTTPINKYLLTLNDTTTTKEVWIKDFYWLRSKTSPVPSNLSESLSSNDKKEKEKLIEKSKKDIKKEKNLEQEKINKEKDEKIKQQQEELEKLKKENEKLLRDKEEQKKKAEKQRANSKTPLIKNSKKGEDQGCCSCFSS